MTTPTKPPRRSAFAAPERRYQRAVQTYCACGDPKKTAAKRCITCAILAREDRQRNAYADQRARTAARRISTTHDDSEASS